MEIKVEPLIWKKKEKRKSEAKNPRMSLIIVLIPRMMLDAIDDLVHDEVFSSRAETIRASIMLMLIELRKLKKKTLGLSNAWFTEHQMPTNGGIRSDDWQKCPRSFEIEGK